MKATLYTILLLSQASLALGQQTNHVPYSSYDHHKEVVKLLEAQERSMGALEKPTGANQRVIAQSYRSGIYFDSTTYRYSSTRGSRFNYNFLAYPLILEPSEAVSPKSADPTYVQADTTAEYKDSLEYTQSCTYSNDNKLVEVTANFFSEFSTIRHIRILQDYNMDGTDRVGYHWQTETASFGDTTTQIRTTYIAGKRIVDSSFGKNNGSWELGSYIRHNYDLANRRISDSLFAIVPGSTASELKQVTTMTYYPDNRAKTFVTDFYNDGERFQTAADSFGYQSGIAYTTFWQSESIVPDFPSHTVRREIRFPGSNGLPDSVQTSFTLTDNSTSRQTYKFHYNSANNPDYVLGYNDGNGGGVPDVQYQFYYENYDDGLSINDNLDRNSIDIFPNPFLDKLSIKLSDKTPTRIHISLTDAIGRILLSEDVLMTDGLYQISTPNIVAGVYYLRLSDINGNWLSKKLLKQVK